ncbi:MAG: hypothetical protein P8Y79_05470 [Ignavibacteriaceae bacterium]
MKTIATYFFLSLFLFLEVFAQQNYWERRFKDYTNPDELVTMSESLPFDQAIQLISKVSESTTGKRVVSAVQRTDPIGVEIVNMPYDKALTVIVQYANLMYEEKEDLIVIKSKTEEQKHSADTYASVNSREVKISAVFFEMDVEKSKKVGFDWKFLLSGKSSDIAGFLRTESQSATDNSGSSGDNSGGSGSDFAGNTVEKFFPTGTIIDVTPYIYNEEGINYILLNITVERSSFSQNETTTQINKTNASTQVMMLDGEETILGGLFVNEETTTRNGIPFLKDLPWWVLGIRYLTGSDEKVVRKKELVILLKAELVPTLKERFAHPDTKNLIQSQINRDQKRIQYYQLHETPVKDGMN